jgi:hypothetical protein
MTIAQRLESGRVWAGDLSQGLKLRVVPADNPFDRITREFCGQHDANRCQGPCRVYDKLFYDRFALSGA